MSVRLTWPPCTRSGSATAHSPVPALSDAIGLSVSWPVTDGIITDLGIGICIWKQPHLVYEFSRIISVDRWEYIDSDAMVVPGFSAPDRPVF